MCINLPGFGGSDAPQILNKSIEEYCEAVWQEIRRQVPEGRVRLAGHSHGTMVGYILAVKHAKDIEHLDLFCPIIRPRLAPRIPINIIRTLRSVNVSPALIIRLISRPLLVSMVTRYSLRPDWSPDVRQRVIAMREREVQFYTPMLFDLMQHMLQFKSSMEDSHNDVPTFICYVTDDNVSGPTDHLWYQSHSNAVEVVAIDGGHLCVPADPERVVRLVRSAVSDLAHPDMK